jgi:2-C-methyl-D-erythritol 4-phosphate cytidylyltransferase
MVYALIVAGGKGTRFSSPKPKQYQPLAGIPILSRTLRAFDASPAVDRMVLVVPESDIHFVRDSMVAAAGLQREVLIVAGGRHRQDSVFNGLRQIYDRGEAVVIIHDGVRPLIAPDMITRCVELAREQGACVTALPAWETLKRATSMGTVAETLPREGVWLAQTPQAFRMDLIRAAHESARRDCFLGTDDASLVERMGAAVHILPGSRCNIKITTTEDLAFAEALLRGCEQPK